MTSTHAAGAAEIAITGFSCRLPGAADPAAFWELLRSGNDAISAWPAGRTEFRTPTATGIRRGAFLADVTGFDAQFFGISAREAAAMDPRQRLVLELAWEALEDAGTVPDRLRGTDAAVFVGAHRDDYAALLATAEDASITHHTLTGASRGVIANRLSYFLGARGPSLTVDSAQSSSLVAVHLACQSLRSGEASTALVAGVNLNLAESGAVATERFGGLSPTGTSAAFDASADGFVRGEGAVVLVLEPLAEALAAGRRVHGVILGSAVNNDGATDGLTVPGQQGQEQVLREAYRRAGVSPAQVQYVEAHGTGTPVGDPIEAAALGAVLGAGRAAPLRIGSAKTNVGHLEGAAGLTGLLKVLLALKHRQLPPSLGYSEPNPAIAFDELSLAVQTELTPWPAPDAALLAGVSSFGMGGTNCHVVVGAGPDPEPAAPGRRPAVVPLVLSAKTPEALAAAAGRLDLTGRDAVDVGWSLVRTRASFEHRAVVWGADERALLGGLAAVAAGLPSPALVSGRVEPGALAVVFAGQGGQRTGMGLGLYAEYPAFAAAFDEVAAHLDGELERPLRELIASGARLDETGHAQPALFALEVALFRLAESWGVAPDFVAGHSIGEIAAAHAAGVLSLADAARLVAARGRLMQALPAGGAMIALEASAEEVAPLLAGRPELGIAAINGPRAVVVAGAEADALAVAEQFAGRGRKVKRLRVSHAFHSPLMEPMLSEFADVVGTLRFEQPRLRGVSSVTGGDATDWASADYWVEHVRKPVRFLDAVRALERAGVATVLEAGPDGICSAMIADAAEHPERIAAVPVLRPDRSEPETAVAAAARLHVRGAGVDWAALFAESGARVVDLPTYPFQRRRYPLPGASADWSGASVADATERSSHGTENRSDGQTAAHQAVPGAGGQSAVAENGSSQRNLPADLDHLVLTHVRAVLGLDPTERLDERARFRDLGFDSLLGVELRTSLARALDRSLPGGLLFDYPTPAALIEFLRAELSGAAIDLDAVSAVATTDDPIAIVGMACRFPGGVTGPDELWRVVLDGVDATSEFPADRGWDDALFDASPERAGRSYVRRGGFLDGAGDFDAGLFGISPREALGMDPEQRLLLETSWEAVEHAGINPQSLSGTRAGVFVGATTSDYGPRMHTPAAGTDGYVLTGTAPSVMSGRVAYQLGLLGPALTVDTACSSSLVAIHLAVRSLRSGEATLALAGGVAVMANPGMFVEFSRQRGLAPDGRCKPFAAAADGTAWAEGAGVLVLERLSEARRHGRRVLGVIRGTAINQDGASNGLTAPNGPAQRRVIASALADAGLTADAVDAVEAHGTGTALGDPIEADAILATYGARHAEDRPLYLGSLKSNIGHAQAAAGVGGVIKMVQALRHATLPKTLHVDAPTPHVDWSAGAVELLVEQRDWPRGERPRRAGISSFGISGTNAHLVLEEGDPSAPVAADHADETVAWFLSARDRAALRAQADRLADFVSARPELPVGAVARSLVTSRALLDERAAVFGRTADELLAGLRALRDDADAPGLVTGRAAKTGRTAFLFTGQGAQRLGMGRELHTRSEVFAAAFDDVCTAFDPWLERGLREVVFGDDADLLDRTEYTQPALFAVEVALAALCAHAGLVPDLVAGHSIGELAALHVAGGIGLADAARLVAARGRLMQAARAGGTMVAIAATAEEIAESLGAGVDLAAVNGPDAVVLSGDAEAVRAVADRWRDAGRRTRELRVSHAFHSAHMDGVLDEFRQVAASVRFTAPAIPVVSTYAPGEAESSSPDYWVRQLRGTVRFHDAVRRLERDGARVFVEIGPDAVLTGLARASFAESGSVAVALQRDGRPEDETFRVGVHTAHVYGAPAEPTALYETDSAPVELPTYAFQHTRYWLPTGTDRSDTGHPLLTARLDPADRDEVLFGGRVTGADHGWLRDHVIADTALLPATAFVDLALAAAGEVGAGQVSELVVEAALPLDGPVDLQVVAAAADDTGRRALAIHARPADDGGAWTRHASGFLDAEAPAAAPVGAWPPADAEEVPVGDLYERLAEIGYAYGPAFRLVTRLWRREGELFAEIGEVTGADRYAVHPALFDAVLHPLVLELAASSEPGELLLPYAFTGVRVANPSRGALRARLTSTGDRSVTIAVSGADGTPVVTVDSLDLRPTAVAGSATRPPLYGVTWSPLPGADQADAVAVEVPAGRGPEAAHAGEADAVALEVPAGRAPEAVYAAVSLAAQTIRERIADGAPPLVLITRGAVAVTPDERVTDLAGAAVWGLGRVAATEHPGRFLLLDLPEGEEIGAWPRRAVGSGESQLAVRDGKLFAPKVIKRTAAPAPRPIRTDGTVLVTGGTGGLGALIAKHLVTAHGVRHLVLVSRRGPAAPGVDRLLGELSDAGATARVIAADVADAAGVADVLGAIPDDRPLRAVVHAAGTLADATLDALTDERIATVLRPKVDAAWYLHEATAELDLDAFLLFSSLSGHVGTAGQGSYAAANTYLDGLAAYRASLGLPALSLAWGLWEAGMGTGLSDTDVERWKRVGTPPLTADQGLALFDAALAHPDPVVVAARIDTAAAAANGPAILRPPTRRTTAARGGGWAAAIEALPEDERAAAILDYVTAASATVLGHTSAAGIDVDTAFRELGFDSLAGLELRNKVSADTGIALSATVVFDHPSPAAFAAHLGELLKPEKTTTAVAFTATARTDDDPIVIVGMACRYPGGVRTPADLWRLVSEGVDAISEFPVNRGWNVDDLFDPTGERGGTSITKQGGFLHEADVFDAAFFGISPREATAIDPQQRLLLETSWEAMENAAIDPATLRGSRTGVFTGAMYDDYAVRVQGAAGEFEGLLLAGNLSSVVSGRLSYTFGFEGPAITVDTACSSSLVALHLAAQSLRSGECDLALAGGVTVMSTPNTFIEFSRQRGLSADGRCRSYGAGAGGTGWSEGVGLVVLERLSDAVAAGREVLGVLRGSAVNQDGASNGLTAPSGRAQEGVVRAALVDARLSGGGVDVVEGHGTGTRLGDPIEVGALQATYGRERPEGRPLYLGSLKSNIGHAQAAAGVGGVIKMLEAMRRGVLPKSLYAEEPSTEVDWSSGTIELLSEAREWPETGEPRRAGVSSFGVSGTNAHVILEQAPEPAVTARPDVPVPWILSAKDDDGLRAVAERLRDHLDGAGADQSTVDIAHTLATGRARHDVRAAFVGDRAAARAALADIATGATNSTVVRTERGRRGKLAFLFTGQGSQRLGMGRELYESSRVYADAFDAVYAELDPQFLRPLKDVLFAPVDSADSALLDQTHYTQAALFAVETALYRTVESYGLRPDYVTGHSIGEVTAAHVAGVLDLRDAAVLVAARGRLMQAARSRGAMIAVQATEAEVAGTLAPYGEAVVIAGVNGPQSMVISGDAGPAEQVAALWRERGRKVKRLPVSHAFHSPHMDGVLDEFHAAIADLDFRTPRLPVVSNVTGDIADPAALTDPGYWVRHIRLPVRFLDGVQALERAGVTDFVEIGPDGVLSALVQQTLAEAGGVALPVLRDGRPEQQTLISAVTAAAARGHGVDWAALIPGGRRIALPTYPFRGTRYWLEPVGRTADIASFGLGSADHALLGAVVPIANRDEFRFTVRLGAGTHPWLADHGVDGATVVAGTALVEMVLHAAGHAGCDELAELTIGAPLTLPPGGVTVQVGIGAPDEHGRRQAEIHSRTADGEWDTHATGFVAVAQGEPVDAPASGAEHSEVDLTGVYDRLEERGYHYGPAFRGLRRVRAADGELLVEVELPEERHGDTVDLHPALLDAALHALLPGVVTDDSPAWLPFVWSGVRVVATGAAALRVRLGVLESSAESMRVSLHADDPSGRPVATVESLVLRPRSAIAATTGVDGLFVPRLRAIPAGEDAVGVRLVDATTGAPTEVLHATLDTARDWLSEPGDDRLALVIASGDLAQSGVRGLVRSAAAENPGRITVVETDGTAAAHELIDRAARSGEPHVIVRDGALFAPRWERVRTTGGQSPDWSAGTVLITGGTGALGALIARHLVVRHGATDLLLLSRRGPDAPGAADLAAELTALGATVALAAADVADRDELVAAIGDRRIGAVIHTAGVTDDGVVTALTHDQLDRVLRPKVDAAWNLHEVTLAHEPAAFVLYSSVAGLLGTAGQANYAAANTYLDALAEHRHERGLPAVSLAWGLWSGTSELSGHLDDVDLRRLARSGLQPLDPADALDLFDAAVATGEPVLAVTRLDRDALSGDTAALPAPLRELVRTRVRRAVAATGEPDLRDRLANLDHDGRIAALIDFVRARAAAVLGHADPGAVTGDRQFQELGFDSLMAVELRNVLAGALGLTLPATVIFDHSSPVALAEHLLEQLGFEARPRETSVLSLIDGLRPAITAALEDSADDSTAIAARLRELLGLVTADADFESQLDAASDEELYALVDEFD
ncbi:type I polyketide synthase [Nocardia puris]|nr:type I polyketide synthase [Nocardia puris]